MAESRKLADEEIIARLRTVCRCRKVNLGRISDAIRNGADSVAQVNRITGSGSGDCKAKRCRPIIEEMLRNGGRPPARAT